MPRASRRSVATLVLLIIAACAVRTEETIGSSSERITVGVNDTDDANSNIVVCLPGSSGSARGTGFLITPLLYLTANHVVTGSTSPSVPVKPLNMASIGPNVLGGSYLIDPKKPPVDRKSTAMDRTDINDIARDLALVYLDASQLDNPSIWKPVLSLRIARPARA